MYRHQLRSYQVRIVKSVGLSNAIVKMPTGSGKTIVAATLVDEALKQDATRSALFLVPTRDLVDQQSEVLRAWCADTTVFLFTGGMAVPRTEEAKGKTCIVSTPKAFLTLQNRQQDAFGWERFSIVVFDEVHHVLKDHPYRHIALGLKDWNESREEGSHGQIQIIGLSASLSYGIGESAIRTTLNRLCHELQIERMESPSIDELINGGYVPQHGRNVETERVSDATEGVIPTPQRKPHLMHRTFMERVACNTATPFALNVWHVVKSIESMVKKVDPLFRSPLSMAKLVSWEDYAHKRASVAAAPVTTLLNLLEHWYVALRLLVQSWEENEGLALSWLKMCRAFDTVQVPECLEMRNQAENPENGFKFDRLLYHLIQKREMKGPSFRCIVFVQQRITAVVISHFINDNSDVGRLGLQSGFVAARESKITPSIIMTKVIVKRTIDDFRSGRINIIVATSVIEEVSILVIVLELFRFSLPGSLRRLSIFTHQCHPSLLQRALMSLLPMS